MGLIELPTEIVDSSQQITAICNQAQDNQFVITGRGGIPASPENHWSSDRPWSDLRDLNLAASEQPATLNSVPPIQEATALQMNGNGQLELVALLLLAPASSSNATCSGGQI
jgi:large exoprotein involved in heme utilization and adhesion